MAKPNCRETAAQSMHKGGVWPVKQKETTSTANREGKVDVGVHGRNIRRCIQLSLAATCGPIP